MTRFLKIAGLAILGLYAAQIVTLFMGSAFSDPGRMAAVLIVGMPAALVAGLGFVLRRRPALGLAILVPLSGLAVISAFARWPDLAWQLPTWSEAYFTVFPAAVFILAGIHAVSRPLEAGAVLVLTAIPVGAAQPEIAAFLAAPAIAAGVLLAFSGLLAAPGAGRRPGVP